MGAFSKAELQQMCRDADLAITGKKGELVERLRALREPRASTPVSEPQLNLTGPMESTIRPQIQPSCREQQLEAERDQLLQTVVSMHGRSRAFFTPKDLHDVLPVFDPSDKSGWTTSQWIEQTEALKEFYCTTLMRRCYCSPYQQN